MMKFTHSIFLFIFAAVIANVVLAEPEPLASPTDGNWLTMSESQAAKLSPTLQKIRLVVIEQLDAVAALEVELSVATNAQHIHQLEKKMADVMLVAEIEILEIQAIQMASEGHHDEAKVLAAEAETLKNPVPRPAAKSVPQRQEVQK